MSFWQRQKGAIKAVLAALALLVASLLADPIFDDEQIRRDRDPRRHRGMSVRVPRETIEKFEVIVTTDTDPTGGAVEFAFVDEDTRPSTWTAGTWDGSYANGRATAVSPTVGTTDSGATVELAPGTYTAYVKVDVSPEEPVRECGSVTLA